MPTAPTPRGLVLVASTRAAAGIYPDKTGPLLVAWLRERGLAVPDPIVVPDKDIASTVEKYLHDGDRPAVLITTGGTGLGPDDQTVEAVRPHLDRELSGLVHAFFARGMQATPTAVLSRAVAGTAGACFIMTLPGSPGAVKDGIAVIDPVLPHLLHLLGHTHD